MKNKSEWLFKKNINIVCWRNENVIQTINHIELLIWNKILYIES